MEPIAIVYFFYMFVSLYFLSLSLVIYFHNRNRIALDPIANKPYFLSILIPAYNEEGTIANTIHSVFETNYKFLKEVIVINDGSKDKTLEIAKSLERKYPLLKVIDKKNSGKADSLNQAIRIVKGDFITIIDADSYPDKDAFSKMMGYFDDKKVGVVTAACTPINRETFLGRLQSIEYKVIAFTRKLLEFIDSIYVAPGSLSIYRKKALKDIGGFDPTNLTEDIESTWHLLKDGWKVRMSLSASVKTVVPTKLKDWWKQRVRWTVGGFQVIKKYIGYIFRNGMFGYFVIPFFLFGLVIGIMGLGIFIYLGIIKIIQNIGIMLYKLNSDLSPVTLSDLNLNPTLLNYFGITLFIFFLIFTLFVLLSMKDKSLKNENFLEILFYMTLYLIAYPPMIIWSVYKWIKGGVLWR